MIESQLTKKVNVWYEIACIRCYVLDVKTYVRAMIVTTAATTVIQGVIEKDMDWRNAVFCKALISSRRMFCIFSLKESSQAYILIRRILLITSFIKDTLFSVCTRTFLLKCAVKVATPPCFKNIGKLLIFVDICPSHSLDCQKTKTTEFSINNKLF